MIQNSILKPKNLFIAFSFFFLFGLILLSPKPAKAIWGFGSLGVRTYQRNADGSLSPLPGVNVTVYSDDGDSYEGRCDTNEWGDRACSSAGIVDFDPSPDRCMSQINETTGGDGLVSFPGDVYGFSACNCDFKINLSSPGSGSWNVGLPYNQAAWGNDNYAEPSFIWIPFYNPEGWLENASCGLSTAGNSVVSGWAADRDNVNQSINVHLYVTSFTQTYVRQVDGSTMDSSNPWYGAAVWADFPAKQNNEVFFQEVPANIFRQDLVNAGYGNGNHGFSWQIPSWARNGQTWYTYAYGINIGGGINAPLSGSPKSFLCPHEIVCTSLNPSPASGYVPLVVDFTANIIDTFGHPITTYEWDFDGDGTYEKTTSTNTINYTYTAKGKYTPKVRGSSGEPGIPSQSCPVTADVKSSSWSKTDWVEIAP